MEEEVNLERKILKKIRELKEIRDKYWNLLDEARSKKIKFLEYYIVTTDEKAQIELDQYRIDLCKERGD